MVLASPDVSDRVLEATPEKAFGILRMLKRHPGLWILMASRGYGVADHDAGWAALDALVRPEPAGPITSLDPVVQAAEAFVLQWDNAWLGVVGAAWEFDFPIQFEWFFRDGLAPSSGPESVQTVFQSLKRLNDLSNDRGPSPGEQGSDRVAMTALARFGLTPEVRAEAQRQLDIVRKGEDAPAADPMAVPAAADPAVRREQLLTVYRWWKRWSTIADLVITRADHRTWLGLAPPRTRKRRRTIRVVRETAH